MPKILFLGLCLSGLLAVGSVRADAPSASTPAATATPAPVVKPTPVGNWKWFVGPALTFDAKGAVTGTRRPAVWFWLDEDKRELQVVWGGPDPGLDKLTLSEDGNRLEGSNNDGTPISGSRIVEAPEPAAPAAGTGVVTNVSPLGTWSWFFGPDLTFHEDGTVTGENRTARWVWTDQSKRELRVDFGGDYSGYRDSLTLSEDGKRLRGVNNTGMEISGDRLASPTPTPAGNGEQKSAKPE